MTKALKKGGDSEESPLLIEAHPNSPKLRSLQAEEPFRRAGINRKRVGETAATVKDAGGVRCPGCHWGGHVCRSEPGIAGARRTAGTLQDQVATRDRGRGDPGW